MLVSRAFRRFSLFGTLYAYNYVNQKFEEMGRKEMKFYKIVIAAIYFLMAVLIIIALTL